MQDWNGLEFFSVSLHLLCEISTRRILTQFLEQERLPYAEGWARSESELTAAMVLAKAAGVLTA